MYLPGTDLKGTVTVLTCIAICLLGNFGIYLSTQKQCDKSYSVDQKRRVLEDGDTRFENETFRSKNASDANRQVSINCSLLVTPSARYTGTGLLADSYNPVADYVTYPCVPGLFVKHGRYGPCVRTVNITNVAVTVSDKECVTLKISSPTPICIHDPRLDVFVSASLLAIGTWEKRLVANFTKALDRMGNVSHVLDLGCNVGVYSLTAAKAGRTVVSVDANKANLRLLAKSVHLGRLQEHVTLIWNAVSDTYTNVTMNVPMAGPENIGGYSIKHPNRNSTRSYVTIETILLDDLIPLFTNKSVAIKMDVEKAEPQILQGGILFFTKIDVRFVQIEMAFHRHGPNNLGGDIISFFRLFRFKPFRSCLGDQSLENVPLQEWPIDACFIKSS